MHEKAWRQPKYMLLSETSQSGKFTDSMIQTIWHTGKCTTFGVYKKQLSSFQHLGKKEGWIDEGMNKFFRKGKY